MSHLARPILLQYPSPLDVIPHHLDATNCTVVLEYVTRQRDHANENKKPGPSVRNTPGSLTQVDARLRYS